MVSCRPEEYRVCSWNMRLEHEVVKMVVEMVVEKVVNYARVVADKFPTRIEGHLLLPHSTAANPRRLNHLVIFASPGLAWQTH